MRFTPYSWSKLLYLRDIGGTEVGGFGISDADKMLSVTRFSLVNQRCTAVSVEFDDAAVADFFDQQVDLGRVPEQFGRIWIHTHPGDCPTPSPTDEDTFARCFGSSDWAVMFILAAGGATYARLQFNVGPKASYRIGVDVDYTCEFEGTDVDGWDEEYLNNVEPIDPFQGIHTNRVTTFFEADPAPEHISDVLDDWYERADAIDLFPEEEKEEAWNQYLAAAD